VYRGGVPYAVHSDHLASPRRISDANAAPVWNWDFFGATTANAFGENAAQNETAAPSGFTYANRFPGQYLDAQSGVHYNYFRDYEPGTGRYVESDTLGLVDGPSTYSYTRSAPLTYVDPTGEASTKGKGFPNERGSCRPSEVEFCEKECAARGETYGGCYVTLWWRVKGMRNGRPIKSEQRKVNCRCEPTFCQENVGTCAAAYSLGAVALFLGTQIVRCGLLVGAAAGAGS
jgi:RHS repeat-associated protein